MYNNSHGAMCCGPPCISIEMPTRVGLKSIVCGEPAINTIYDERIALNLSRICCFTLLVCVDKAFILLNKINIIIVSKFIVCEHFNATCTLEL